MLISSGSQVESTCWSIVDQQSTLKNNMLINCWSTCSFWNQHVDQLLINKLIFHGFRHLVNMLIYSWSTCWLAESTCWSTVDQRWLARCLDSSRFLLICLSPSVCMCSCICVCLRVCVGEYACVFGYVSVSMCGVLSVCVFVYFCVCIRFFMCGVLSMCICVGGVWSLCVSVCAFFLFLFSSPHSTSKTLMQH